MTDSSTTEPGSHCRGVCVIMAGGRGTRFWPLSRIDRPKQLQALASGRSLLRDTFERLEPLVGADRILVVTSGSLAEATRADLPELPPANVITEPVGRNTAPCAVLGMGVAGQLAPGAPVALLPADHFIPDDDLFRAQLAEAFAFAEARETVVTFGVTPDRPETGYGYLEADAGEDQGFRPGKAFVEKPDAVTAEGYVRSGNHFWNSGIFVWNSTWFSAQADRFIPAVTALMAPVITAFGTNSFTAALETAYRDCPADSIDFAVMEKLPGFYLQPARFRWSDLGAWDAWGDLAPELSDANRGQGDLIAVDSTDNVVRVPDRLVALVGIHDMIIVDTPDALLVCRKSEAQRIKDVIARLESGDRKDLL